MYNTIVLCIIVTYLDAKLSVDVRKIHTYGMIIRDALAPSVYYKPFQHRTESNSSPQHSWIWHFYFDFFLNNWYLTGGAILNILSTSVDIIYIQKFESISNLWMMRREMWCDAMWCDEWETVAYILLFIELQIDCVRVCMWRAYNMEMDIWLCGYIDWNKNAYIRYYWMCRKYCVYFHSCRQAFKSNNNRSRSHPRVRPEFSLSDDPNSDQPSSVLYPMLSTFSISCSFICSCSVRSASIKSEKWIESDCAVNLVYTYTHPFRHQYCVPLSHWLCALKSSTKATKFKLSYESVFFISENSFLAS